MGDLAGGELRSEAWDATLVGGRVVVVGSGRSPNDEAFRWQDNGGGDEGEFELDIFHGRYLCVPSEKLRWKVVAD
jgi:hypothetical protein